LFVAAALSAHESSRFEFLAQLGSVVGAAVLVSPGVANAAQYGSFGAASPNVFDPKDAIVDEAILKSDAVQKSIATVKAYLNGVRSMQEGLKVNAQADIGPYLRKEFDFVKLREQLNVVNTAFDEDTQRGTDRLIRNIMQDITELDTANRQKEGVARSERRLEIMNGKLDKLAKGFEDFLSFSS
jgi:hypothetical protein